MNLDKPFQQASLADHRRLAIELKDFSIYKETICRFLDVDTSEMLVESWSFPAYELPNYDRAIRNGFPDWEMVDNVWKRHGYLGPEDGYERYRIGPHSWTHCLTEGMRFFRLPDGSGRVIDVTDVHSMRDRQLHLTFRGPESQRTQILAEISRMHRWARKRHYLKRQAIRADASLLPERHRASWDDVALPPHVRQTLEENTIGFLRRRNQFRECGIPQSRGILLHGPPGNGKTMIGKVLAGMGKATFLFVSAADATEPGALRRIFRLARRLRPTIVFLEDLDFYAADRQWSRLPSCLGELLSQLDGFERNDGLVVIATTNDLEAIEPAIRERPSRFDLVLQIGMPSAAARRRIIELNLGQVATEPGMIAEAARKTDQLSGAQVREVAVQLVQQAILRSSPDAASRIEVTSADLDAALSRLLGRQERQIGFQVESSGWNHGLTAVSEASRED